MNTFQVNFRPTHSKVWKKDAAKIIKILTAKYPRGLKNILLHPAYKYFKIVMFPFFLLGKLLSLLVRRNEEDTDIGITQGDEKITQDQTKDILENPDKIDAKFLSKISSEGYEVDINVICAGENEIEVRSAI